MTLNRTSFEGLNSTQKFLVIVKKDIGEIYSLRVWHENSGNVPSRHLEERTITNPNSEAVGRLHSRHG